jgi:hypothetical protein
VAFEIACLYAKSIEYLATSILNFQIISYNVMYS